MERLGMGLHEGVAVQARGMKVQTAILALRERMKKTYGEHADLAVIDSVLRSKLAYKMLEDVDSVVNSFTVDELIEALKVNAAESL